MKSRIIYVFTFRLLPTEHRHEDRWIARFIKNALRSYGLRLIGMSRTEEKK